MKKINTRKELIDMIENIRALEVVARDTYANDLHLFETEEIVKTIQLIKLDEDKHIKLLDYLLSLLKK